MGTLSPNADPRPELSTCLDPEEARKVLLQVLERKSTQIARSQAEHTGLRAGDNIPSHGLSKQGFHRKQIATTRKASQAGTGLSRQVARLPVSGQMMPSWVWAWARRLKESRGCSEALQGGSTFRKDGNQGQEV